MEIISSFSQLHKFSKPCVIALGTFDGLHRGHVDIIEAARLEALSSGALLAVFTFQNHPATYIRPDLVPPALITSEARHKAFEKLGVDVLIEVPFDEELCFMSPEDFVKNLSEVGFSALVIGDNFTYGAYGKGNKESLEASSKAQGFKLIVRSLVRDGDTTMSSTVIRKLILSGTVREANRLLGYQYALTGKVVHGLKRGRTIGVPTANLDLTGVKLAIPQAGAYAVLVDVAGKIYQGMANVGDNPTFSDVLSKRLEVNIFDFAEDSYGKEISIIFVEMVRGEIKFSSLEALKDQLAKDKISCEKILSQL